ncbi:MAG: hypothetical protein FWD13_07645 [Treponema sp.]|nr:hypothetical protein [Treponema sp.]
MPDEKQAMIDTKKVAEITGMSVRWVVDNRHRIIGARREGRLWRFDEAKIRCRMAAAKSIID